MENFEVFLNNQSKFKENCQKSFSTLSKCNLNSEVKEKETIDKGNFVFSKELSKSSPFSLSQKGTAHHSKPQNFIDNRPNGLQRPKVKTSNQGIGRGSYLQNKMEEDNLVNRIHRYLLDGEGCPVDPEEDFFRMPVAYQMDKVFGNSYCVSNLRKSSGDVSSCHLSPGEGESTLLERAMSDISLSNTCTDSSASERERLTGARTRGPRRRSEWVPEESMLDPASRFNNELTHLN